MWGLVVSRFSWAFKTVLFHFFVIWGWVSGGLFLYILVMKRQGHREKGETKFQRSWLMVYWGGLGFCSFLVWLCLGSLWLFLDQTPLHFPPFPWENFGYDSDLSWEVVHEICRGFGVLKHFGAPHWLKHTLKQHIFGVFRERQGLLLTSLFVYRANSK